MADRTEKLNRRTTGLGSMLSGLRAQVVGTRRFGATLRAAPRMVLLAAIIWALTGPIDRVPLAAGAAGPGGAATLPGAAVQAAPFFQETGYAVAEGPIASYFVARGGVRTFGPPVSNQFPLLGSNIQIFRDHMLKMEPNGSVSTVNLFAMNAIPFRNIGGRIVPEIDQALLATAPPAGAPNYAAQVQAFIQTNAPDTWEGLPVGFYQAFLKTVSYEDAFPNGGERALLPGFAHEVWGVPLSRPVRDAQNPDFVLQRWERGVMVWSRQSGAVTAVPLGETFKAVLTGQGLGPERTAAAAGSPFLLQLNPASPNGIARPADLPNTLLANAFTQGNAAVNAAQLAESTPLPTLAPPVATPVQPPPPANPPPAAAPPAAAAAAPPPATPTTVGSDPCYGDELITYSPDLPRSGNEMLVAVTSSRPHPYGRLAGTEKTTFVRERPGQKGYVWEWTVQLTFAGNQEYIFYVDSTIPCKKIEVQVRQSLATRTPTPTKTATPFGQNNGNTNSNNNSNNNDNVATAPRINPASFIVAGVNQYDCNAFQSQFNAQAVLRQDPSDPNRLDAEDGTEDGIACTNTSYGSYPDDDDYNIVNRVYSTATPLAPTATATLRPFTATDYLMPDPNRPGKYADAYSCDYFSSQAQAQAILRADPNDPNRLDTHRPSAPGSAVYVPTPDGIACNTRPEAPGWWAAPGGYRPPLPQDFGPVPTPVGGRKP